MIQIDLITGFLGAGKTTFIKEYAKYLMNQGLSIGILENDFGAVNVDALLLQDILGDQCTLEMVAGGCDADCHKRRFKTKLIAMGMCGYDRVLVEPSGIFDMDEFFDTIHEEPLDRWYTIGNVITIVDAGIDQNLSKASRYLLASQAAQAGTILYSHVSEVTEEQLDATKQYVEEALHELNCQKQEAKNVIEKDFGSLEEADYQAILRSGYQIADYQKLWFDDQETYDSVYLMNKDFTKEHLIKTSEKILKDENCGNVFRIKGFQKLEDGSFISLNITKQKMNIEPVTTGQNVVIVIGEQLNKERIEKYLEEK